MRILDLGRVVGLSAYELAVQEGYTGTLQEWLESLRYDHSDEYKQFTEKIEAARVEIDADVRTIRQLVEAGLADIARTGETAVSNVNQAKGDALSDIERLANGARADIESGVRQITDDTDAALADIEDAGKDALTILTTALGKAMDTISGSGSSWSTQIEQLGLLTKGEIENFVGVKKTEITEHTEDEMDVFDAHAAEKTAEFDEHTADYRHATEQDAIDAEQDAHIASVEHKIGQANIPALERRVTNLEYASKGVLFREETDGATAYTKSVPSGALPYGTLDSLGGKSVVLNQLIDYNTTTRTVSGVSVSFDGGIYTLNGSVGASGSAWIDIASKTLIKSGHKYYVRAIGMQDKMYFYVKGIGSVVSTRIVTAQSTEQNVASYIVINNTSQEVYSVDANVNTAIIDLTQMFGSAADTMTVADVEAIIGTDYIPYNTGEIVTAEPKSVDSVGANLWDEEWELGTLNTATGEPTSISSNQIRAASMIDVDGGDSIHVVLPNSTIRLWALFYDDNRNVIQNPRTQSDVFNSNNAIGFKLEHTTYLLPNNARYMRFYISDNYGTTYKHDIAIIQGTSGTYSPYFHAENPLPTSLPTLLGINDTVYDYIDFEPVLYKNMKSVDLGSLNWAYGSNLFITDNFGVVQQTTNILSEIGFVPCATWNEFTALSDMAIRVHTDGKVYIKYAKATSVSQFVEAIRGKSFHYEATEGGSDYEAKLLHKKCGSVDFGVLTWSYGSFIGGCWSVRISDLSSNTKNLFSEKYSKGEWGSNLGIGQMAIGGGNAISVNTGSSTDKPIGTLIYELATEQILDVTDILKEWENSIHVEGGGTITFRQDGLHIPVPNAETYLVKVEV